MEDIIDIIVTETTNTIEITSQASDELIDVNIIDNREDITLNVTPTLVEININSLTGNFGVEWGDITGTLADQEDLQDALDLKADLVGGKVPSSQLPSYVDDIVEVANYAALPATGETGKIYVVLDTNKIYRWSGSAYIEIADSTAVWGAITGTLSSQTDLQSALDAKLSVTTAASTYVPYTGATGAVNLGAYDLKVNELTIGKGTSGLSNNTALGHDALFHITTGNYNTGVGHEALHNTTTGQYNTAFGQSSLFTNTTGGQNTAIGLNALLSNTTGGSNTALGLDSLQHNTTGSSNVALGYNAGSHITGGSTPNTSSGTSIYIGRDTRANANGGANEIVIGHATTGNGSNTVTIGNSSITANYLQGSVNAGSFVKSGGTSSEFLKADGSVDSSTYLTTGTAASTYLPLTGGTLSGILRVDSALRIKSGSANGILLETYSTNELRIRVTPTSTTFDMNLVFPSVSRTYTYPNATGTIALTSDLSSYQPLLTNPVTGTGTSGIVAKFNGTSSVTDSIIYDNGTRVSIGADVTTSNKFTAVASTTSSYAVVAQASGAANGFWATLSGTGEIFRGQTSGGSYFIINNGGNAFLNGNLNVGDFASTSYRLNVVGTGNFTGALSGTSASFSGVITASDNIRVYGANQFWFGSAFRGQIVNYGAYAGTTDWSPFFTSETSLAFGVNGNATKALIIATSGNVGIGTTSPAAKLDLGSTYGAPKLLLYNDGTYVNGIGIYANEFRNFFDTIDASTSRMTWGKQTGGGTFTEFMRLTKDGNVGIGTTSPGANFSESLQVTKADISRIGVQHTNTTGNRQSDILFSRNSTNLGQIGTIEGNGSFDNQFWIRGTTDLPMTFWTNGSEKMRINSAGQVLFNTTSAFAAETIQVTSKLSDTTQYGIVIQGNATSYNQVAMRFANQGVAVVGSITFNTSLTSYNITSDYRLKQDFKSVNGLDIVSKINVYNYEWKSDKTRMDGVLAHELAEVLPYAVTGVKDAEEMQSVDYSKIVPVMVQAIKDLKAKIETLENK
jgi:hypothetical protein